MAQDDIFRRKFCRQHTMVWHESRSSLCHNANKAFSKRVTLINHGLGDVVRDCLVITLESISTYV